ncbi:3'-5' exonuclease [Streptomyces microflavus]|uniref:3'-5' exonuclease n=1 Tax=Streptomyces microflavus TaxID=1919 RepID=UPI0033B50587
MTILTFVDTETTHLDPRHGDAWEIAVIRRNEDGVDTEYLWQVRPDLATADPESLKIGRFEERFAVPDGWDAIEVLPSGPPMRENFPAMLFDLQDALQRGVLIGSNPGFDVAFLTKLLQAHGRKLPWHYRPIDIATLAAGFMWAQEPELMAKDTKPISSRWLSRQVGVEPPGDDVAHTALGDARWARDVYDAITRGGTR